MDFLEQFFYNPSFAMTPKLAQDNVGKRYLCTHQIYKLNTQTSQELLIEKIKPQRNLAKMFISRWRITYAEYFNAVSVLS